MSNEYDYSGLYNNGQGGSTPDPNQGQNNDQPRNEANQTSATRPDQPSQPEQGGYPNVGSSGMNTANTARTDYSAGSSTNNTGANTYNQPNNAYGQNNGYTSSFSGGNGGSNGGYNGYSYASAPQQPPKKEKKHNKVLLRVLAGVGVVALGFGGGIGGAVVASRAGLTGNQVVVQEVQRDTSTDASNTGSTNGTSMTMQQIAAVASPSVVAITTEQMSSSQTWFGGYYVQSGAGSGVIISEDGYVLTNNHVISGADKITVYVNPGDGSEEKSYEATLIGSSESNDIAVLKTDATGLNAAAFGDSDQLEVGELAVAIGNPMGQVHGSVTAGIISAVEQELTIDDVTINAIQTDAAINPGNSGGALFDSYGNVIGIVYAKSSSVSIEGIGYAIPVNNIKDLVAQMINDPDSVKDQTKGSQIMLGITIRDITEEMSKQYSMPVGVYITEVSSMSAAERAGLQKGDIITEFAGETVTSADDLNAIKAKQTSGDTVSVKIDRNGKTLTLDLVVPQPTDVDTSSSK